MSKKKLAQFQYLVVFGECKILAAVYRIVAVDEFTHCTLLYSICNWKTALRKVQCILIQELYEFEMDYNATKN